MPRGASPRIARLHHFRGDVQRTGQAVLVAKVTDGPRSELGRSVHIPLRKADLPVLRQIVEMLEALDDPA